MSGDRKKKEWIGVASSPPLSCEELEDLRTRLRRANIDVNLGPADRNQEALTLSVQSEDLDIARQIALGSDEIHK